MMNNSNSRRKAWRSGLLAWVAGLACLWGSGVGLTAWAGSEPTPATGSASASALGAGADAPPPVACPPAPTPLTAQGVQQGQREAQDHGLLWRVERDGRTSWLYGTLHAARREWMFPGPRVLAALQGASDVALEMDLMDAALVQRLGQAIRQPAGAPALPAALQARLERQEARLCLGNSQAGLRPELRAMSVGVMVLRAEGLDPAWAVDGYLAGLAHGLGKTVHSLESPEQQIRLLTGSSTAERNQQVAEALDELEQGQSEQTLRRLANAWARGQADELASYPQWCRCLETPAQRSAMRRMVDERNVRMADQVVRLHRSGRQVFAAVGALHLIGPQGVPALLTRRGFQVTAVPLEAERRP